MPANPKPTELIAVTGKGGVGKSTIAALIIGYLKANSPGPILALDADPDANLAAMLGISVQTTIGDLREDLLREMKNFPAGMSKQNYVEAGLHQIIVETPGLDLITMGRSEGPGCYCFINNLLRKFADDLTPSYQWVVIDNEAGMEHLSRRIASRIDHLIVVVNAGPLSIACAGRIDKLLHDLDRDVRNKYFLLNAVRADRVAAVKDRMAGLSLEYLGAVPHDDAIEDAILRGEPVCSLDGSLAAGAIREVMQRIGAG